MKLNLSLRLRLTLFYTFVSAMILLAGGVIVFFAVRSSIHQSLDESLADAASLAANEIVGSDGKSKPEIQNYATSLAANEILSSDGKPKPETQVEIVQERLPGSTKILIYDQDKKLTDQIGKPKINPPLVPGYMTIDNVRVFTEQLPSGDWVQAMRSEVETLGVLQRTQRALLFGLPMLLLSGLGAGYLIADRALKPVDEVSKLALRISTSGHYKARVPEASGTDEMARLTQTVNAMLGKLEATIDRERAFALAAAHELRTPLAIVQARASLSLERLRSVEHYQQALKTINETSLEMTGLVESLLALARTNQAPPNQEVNLRDLATEVSLSLASQAQERSVHLKLETQSAPTNGDPAALRLAITNLIGNAIKYGHNGGTVWLKTSNQSGVASFEVSDDGVGIPDDQLERLQQPFQRGLGLQAVSGTGLGLALVAAVVEQHGGRLELTRAVEGGLKAAFQIKALKT